MQTNQQTQKVKYLSLNSNDDFPNKFKLFKKNFEQLKCNQPYILITSNISNEHNKEIFELIFSKQKDKMVKFELYSFNLPLNQFKMFTELKWPNLHTLKISFSLLDNDYCQSLSKCELPQLNSLTLNCCSICDIGISHICNGKWKKLKQLNLNGNSFSEQSLCRMDKQKQLFLQKLNISGCNVSGKYMFNLNMNIGWKNLKQLRMGSQNIKNVQMCKKSLRLFTKAQWQNMNELVFAQCNLDNDNAKFLFKCEWKNLNELIIWRNNTADNFIDFLCYANWPQLNYLDLSYSKMTNLGSLTLAKLSIQKIEQSSGKITIPQIIKQIKQFIY